jgi:hypothetical protein
MIKRFLAITVLLISTACHLPHSSHSTPHSTPRSTRGTYSYAVEYTKEGKVMQEFQTKFSYWINDKNKFIVEYDAVVFTYTIKSENDKATHNGSKFKEFDLTPDSDKDVPILIQVFDNKEYGLRMFSEGNVFYQLYQ